MLQVVGFANPGIPAVSAVHFLTRRRTLSSRGVAGR